MKIFITSTIVAFIYGNFLPGLSCALLHTCKGNDLEQCALSADSLLKDPNLVFPDSPSSLDRVCRTWNDFTACIYDYTKNCFTQVEKSRFDEQFKEPAMSMNTLCQDQTYRKEYFKVAPCIQKITTNEAFCGFQYRFLIDQISGSVVTMKQLCCAREKFRQCILTKTGNICAGEDQFFGRQRPGELNSTTFAIQVLDKSLAFIAQQCSLPSIQNDDCPGTDTQVPFYNTHRYDRPPPGRSTPKPRGTQSASGPNSQTGGSGSISNSNNRRLAPTTQDPNGGKSTIRPQVGRQTSNNTNGTNNALNTKLNEIIKSAGSSPFFGNRQQQTNVVGNQQLQNDQPPQQSHLSRSSNDDPKNKNKNTGNYSRDYSVIMILSCNLMVCFTFRNLFKF